MTLGIFGKKEPETVVSPDTELELALQLLCRKYGVIRLVCRPHGYVSLCRWFEREIDRRYLSNCWPCLEEATRRLTRLMVPYDDASVIAERFGDRFHYRGHRLLVLDADFPDNESSKIEAMMRL